VEREAKFIGLVKQQAHPNDCLCEMCGPVVILLLSKYEARRLLAALEDRDGRDTGDWHAQIRMKLTKGLSND
jgi:hypothetical protein